MSLRISSSPDTTSPNRLRQLRRDLRLVRSHLQRQCHQPLLRAVVQVTLDPAPALITGGDHPGPGFDQRTAALRVRDGRGDQLGDLGQPVHRLRRDLPGSGPTGEHRAPHPAVDHDRRSHRAAQPDPAGEHRDRARSRRRSSSTPVDRCSGSSTRDCCLPASSRSTTDDVVSMCPPAAR